MNLGSYGPRVRPRGPEARERGAAAPAARCATTAARFARPASRILSLMSIASCSGKKEVADMVDIFSVACAISDTGVELDKAPLVCASSCSQWTTTP